MILKVSEISTVTSHFLSWELGEYGSCPGQQPLEGDSWRGLQYVPGTVVQALSRNPQICSVVFCCQIVMLTWWQPAILFPSAPVQRLCWGSATFVPAQLGGATCRFLWHLFLLAVFMIPERLELSHAKNINFTLAFLSFLYNKCWGN